MILKRLIPILLVVPLLAACPSGNPNGKMPVDVSNCPARSIRANRARSTYKASPSISTAATCTSRSPPRS